MLRTHRPRHVGGALVLALTLVVTLLVGAVGTAAQAGPTQADPTPAEPSDAPTDSQTATTEPTDGPTDGETSRPEPDSPGLVDKLQAELAPSGLVAREDRIAWKRGLSGGLGVIGNDECPVPSGCTTTLLANRHAGWKVSVSPAGLMSISVPATARGGWYGLTYQLTSNENPDDWVWGSVFIAVTLDSYGAPSGMVFTHPYRKAYRNLLRDRVLRTINSVPPGGTIKLASWSFSSNGYIDALHNAKRRGVSVQIVVANRNKPRNSSIARLQRKFGTTYSETGSWVKKCSLSCRGTQGTMHSKVFLFSHAYRTPNVTMTGSANLTDFAVSNQWNQMNTVSNNAAVYADALNNFNQLKRDVPATPRYVETPLGPYTNYWYPASSTRQSADFLMRALDQVRCTGAINAAKGGRTIIKLVVYAWYEDRGKWLAKKVRQLWNEGCKVQIIYAVSSNPVKKILYSPTGRGRIPMRQIMLTNSDGAPIYYVHAKWMAITGHVGSNRSASYSWHGSFNFSNLGLVSDENFQRITGRATYDRFARDFTMLWKDPHSRAPSPASSIQNVQRTAPAEPRLGTGIYQYMEND